MSSPKLPGLFINGYQQSKQLGVYYVEETINQRHRPGTRYHTMNLRRFTGPEISRSDDPECWPPGPIRQWLDQRGIPYRARVRNLGQFGDVIEEVFEGWRADLTPDQWFEFKLHFG